MLIIKNINSKMVMITATEGVVHDTKTLTEYEVVVVNKKKQGDFIEKEVEADEQ